MKKIVSVLLTLAMLLSLGIPALAENAGEVVIRVGVETDFGGLDPDGSASMTKSTWTPAIYQTLFVLDSYGGEPVGVLASGYEQVDSTTFDITIYDYIYDSAGNHITASDVVYSYEYAKACGTVTNMYYVESVEALDDYTVRLKTSSDNLGVWQYALSTVYIFSQKAHEESGDSFATSACGTGPYTLGEYIPGSTLELIKRDDYWQTDDSLSVPQYIAKADRVIFSVLTETTQMGIALENGSIDLIAAISGSEVDRFVEEDGATPKAGYTIHAQLNPLIDCLFLNMDEGSVFADNPKLREAVLYGIDADAMVTVAIEGKGEATKTFGSRVYADYQAKWDDEDYYTYDPERAAAALAESGFQQATPFRILYQSGAKFKAEAELIQAYLSMLGLNCELLGYDSSLFNEYKYNSSQWDMKLDPCKSPDLLPNIWSYCLNSDNYENGTTNFIHSDELQQKTLDIVTEAGHTDETVDAYHNFLIENNWLRGLIDPYTYAIGKDSIQNIFITARGYVAPWAYDIAG